MTIQDNSKRGGEFDVSNRINITRPLEVSQHVAQLYVQTYGRSDAVSKILNAFDDFVRLFEGRYHGYQHCDTEYHDLQHSLDVTLAMARLMNGHERQHPRHQLGPRRFLLGIVIALFHDSGYIRASNDRYADNGAVYTLTHVTRSGEFLRKYLPGIGLGDHTQLATTLVHFTGYEMDIDSLVVENPRDRKIGELLGTADLIAQMSDRCYLEKCRDRLYREFEMCGLAGKKNPEHPPVFESPEDLLLKTPEFYRSSVLRRLTKNFTNAYQYAHAHFDGLNPYMDYITRNMKHLEKLNETGDYSRLQRRPPQTCCASPRISEDARIPA